MILYPLVTILLLVAPDPRGKAASQPVLPLPKEWIKRPAPSHTELSKSFGNHWRVKLENGQVAVVRNRPFANPPPVKVELKYNVGEIERNNSDLKGTLQWPDGGWLLGFNFGEWGGGLVWLSEDGKQQKRLSDENVIEIIPYPTGAAVITGLTHLTRNRGEVLFIPYHRPIGAAVLRFDLEGMPKQYRVETWRTMLIDRYGGLDLATYKTVPDQWYRIDFNRNVMKPIPPPGFPGSQAEKPESRALAYAKSVARAPDGRLYVSTGTYVVRLTPKGKGYREEWYRHSDSR